MVKKGFALALLSLTLTAAVAVAQNQEEWQKNSEACLSGPAKQKYLQTCKDSDQFASVLACYEGSTEEATHARGSVLKAGRYSVNKYMAKKKPSECK